MNEQSLKDIIRDIAKNSNTLFNNVWRKIVLERFLVRLSRSSFSDKFIYKGGNLLACYIDLGRETKDIDFLAKFFDMDESSAIQVFKEISKIDIGDGFLFSFSSISPFDPNDNSVFRIKFNVLFGNIKDYIQIDVGIDDIVEPIKKSISLSHHNSRPLFEKDVSLKVYPLESIFAEKLETIISKGALNSRMKDYHDLFLICDQSHLNQKRLNTNIKEIFKHRKTKLQIPIEFLKEDYINLQKLWKNYLKKIDQKDINKKLPLEIKEVIQSINDFLKRCD